MDLHYLNLAFGDEIRTLIECASFALVFISISSAIKSAVSLIDALIRKENQ